jgi:hypothetical protein
MIHQLKCPALGDTVPEICYSNVNYWENFEKICGPSKLLMGLLLAKLINYILVSKSYIETKLGTSRSTQKLQ